MRIIDDPILPTEDIAEDPISSTQDTAEETSLLIHDVAEELSLSTEDTTISRSATESLSNGYAAMGLIYSHFAEDGIGCSATPVVPYLVAAGAPDRSY